MMLKKSQRDVRAIKVAAASVAAVLVLILVFKWLDHWRAVRGSLAQIRAELTVIGAPSTDQESLRAEVPVFEMPQKEEKQKYLFRDKLSDQLKKAGIRSEPLQFLPAERSQSFAGHKLLQLQCRRGKGRLDQLFDLLADLNENPYLVGIEELKIKCDEKNRQELDIDLTVSTFAR